MKGKNIAIITGASSGIGREFLKLLLKEDGLDELWAIGRDEQRLKEVKEDDRERIRVFPMDLSERKNLDILDALAESEEVNVRWLVNCAGYAKFCDYGGIDRYTSVNMIDVNVSALVAMCVIFIPQIGRAHV